MFLAVRIPFVMLKQGRLDAAQVGGGLFSFFPFFF